MKIEEPECFEMLAFKLQTPGNSPKENIQHSKNGESLNSINVHFALLRAEEDRQRFSKLNRLIRVIAYCINFVNNCEQRKENRQTTALSTQDLDMALTCCVNTVQLTSYQQEVEELLTYQVVSANKSLKTLHSFIDQKDPLRVYGPLQQSAVLYQIMPQMILPSNHYFT
jgi:hypothetical protein